MNKIGYLNQNLLQTRVPGIAEINAMAGEYRQKGFKLINLGQAVPFYPPPSFAVDALKRELSDPTVHRYSPDPGLPALRTSWARILKGKFQLNVDPEQEMLITAGANMAYLMTVMALINKGDKMGLLTPWYFNHEMAVTMAGGEVVPIPLDAEKGFELDCEHILRIVKAEKIKAVTLVSPNNPTGTTYNPDALQNLTRELLALGVFIIVDETYAFFTDPRIKHFSPGAMEEHPERIITIGSFSKTFAMTGWRVGYLIAPAPLIEEMMKIHDTMVICAPTPGQILVQGCLEAWGWLDDRKRELLHRRSILLENAERFFPWKIQSSGLFFAWLEGPCDGRQTVIRLLTEGRVILIPGDVFGPGFENSFRLSLGGCQESEFIAGIEFLANALVRIVHVRNK